MKIVILTLLVLSGCSWQREPRFYLGQYVKYRTGFFYSKACSGDGVVVDFHKDADGEFFYDLATSSDEKLCPNPFKAVAEADIRTAR